MHENETKILNSQFKTNSPQFASPPQQQIIKFTIEVKNV